MTSIVLPALITHSWRYGSLSSAGMLNAVPDASTGTFTASFQDGLPLITATAEGAGGTPTPQGDMNGILQIITGFQLWVNAGGQFPFSATLSTAIGGYPLGAVIQLSTGTSSVISTVNGNTNNPNTNMAGWAPYGGSTMATLTAVVVAQSTANSAVTAAASAQTTANSAITAAAAAQVSANTAQTTASSAAAVLTAGGTAPAFTLTPASPLSSNSSKTRYGVIFAASSGSNPTLAVSGQPALPLMQYNASGALVPASWTGALVTDVIGNGTQWVVLNSLISIAPNFVSGGYTAISSTGTAQIVLGLGIYFTPTKSGKVVVNFGVVAFSSTADNNGPNNVNVAYGTGTAPSAGAPASGTQVSTGVGFILSDPGGSAYASISKVLSLAVGTTYWIDLSFSPNDAGHSDLNTLGANDYTIFEL